jgi:hypothetical protein
MSPVLPQWHPGFNLDTVQEISKADLPMKKQVSYLNILKKKSNIKSEPNEPESVSIVKIEAVEAPVTHDENGKPLSRAKLLLEKVIIN